MIFGSARRGCRQTLLWPQPTKINMIQSGQISLNENWECRLYLLITYYIHLILDSACKRYHGYISKKIALMNLIKTL